jgi:predicted nucleic acid-binding protein
VIRKDRLEAWNAAARILVGLPIEFHPADRELADLAADFKSRFSLSLADAFAAALARKHKVARRTTVDSLTKWNQALC